MPDFKDIIGHDEIISHLQNAIRPCSVKREEFLLAESAVPASRQSAATSQILSMSAMKSRDLLG